MSEAHYFYQLAIVSLLILSSAQAQVIGKNFDGFPEAKRLQQLAGLFSVSDEQECVQILDKLVSNKAFREKTGMIAGHFVNSNTGATATTMSYIERLNRDGLI